MPVHSVMPDYDLDPDGKPLTLVVLVNRTAVYVYSAEVDRRVIGGRLIDK